MTFFYDLNKRLADLASKQDAKQITEEAKAVAPKSKLAQALNERDLGKHNNATTGFKALAKKVGGGEKGNRIAGAQLAKMRAKGQVEESDMADEGNTFGNIIRKAKADGVQKGETVRVGSKIYPVKEADMVGLGEKKKAKPDYIDLDSDGNKKETMKKAASDKKRSTGTAFDKEHMDKVRKEKEAETHSRYDVQDTGYSKRYTRKADDTDIDKDDEVKSDEPKRKGRPKGPAKGPERTTKGAWKHKGDRKVKEDSINSSNPKVEAWEDLMDLCEQGEGMDPAIQKRLKQLVRTLKPEELELDEEKVEAGKREFFDRLAPAAKKAAQVIKAISKSRTTVEEESTDKEDIKAEKAGKKVAKDIEYDEGNKGKDDDKAEKAGKKVTKDIEYDDKKDRKEKKDDKEEKVDETADAPKAGKGMQFGKGVYEGFNSKVENMITEGMSINISVDEQGKKSISVNATEQDAEALADLLKMAGLGGQGREGSCPTCNQAPCGCAEVVDENSPDYPTNTETSDNALQYSGGLNGPKSTGQTTVPVVASQLRRQVSMEENVELERSLFKTWKNYKG
jgi:hypothetical protein